MVVTKVRVDLISYPRSTLVFLAKTNLEMQRGKATASSRIFTWASAQRSFCFLGSTSTLAF